MLPETLHEALHETQEHSTAREGRFGWRVLALLVPVLAGTLVGVSVLILGALALPKLIDALVIAPPSGIHTETENIATTPDRATASPSPATSGSSTSIALAPTIAPGTGTFLPPSVVPLPFVIVTATRATGRTMLAGVTASKPDGREDAESVPSVWSRVVYRDLTTPGVNDYQMRVSSTTPIRLDYYWCADSYQRLGKILGPVSLRFLVGEQPVEARSILEYTQIGRAGTCYVWNTRLSNWPPRSQVLISITFTLSAPVFDGKTTYPPGEYLHRIMVLVR